MKTVAVRFRKPSMTQSSGIDIPMEHQEVLLINGDALIRLNEDGWQLVRFKRQGQPQNLTEIWYRHREIKTKDDAKERIIKLGIDLDCVVIAFLTVN